MAICHCASCACAARSQGGHVVSVDELSAATSSKPPSPSSTCGRGVPRHCCDAKEPTRVPGYIRLSVQAAAATTTEQKLLGRVRVAAWVKNAEMLTRIPRCSQLADGSRVGHC
ncbi:hypothetical protein ISCGN_000540 [Ixodes scapularis]